MASTSSRLLQLLALLGSRPRWSAADLSDRLDISPRTLRRDVDCLRELGYPVGSAMGPAGGYSLGTGGKLPPLLLDDEQAVAVAIALQTAPVTVRGIDEAVARALTSIKQVMPADLRAEAESMHVTAIANPWEFAAPPVRAGILRCLGATIRNAHRLRLDYLAPDGRRRDPADPDFTPPMTVEAHHLVVWAARWYLVAYVPSDEKWTIFRVDRILSAVSLGTVFERRALPGSDVARYVMTSHDRGDTPAEWQCVGTVVLDLPPDVVARWAPGGSVIERFSANQSLLTLGAWSWAGIAGLLATFDADFTVVGPEPLRQACRTISRRLSASAEPVHSSAVAGETHASAHVAR